MRCDMTNKNEIKDISTITMDDLAYSEITINEILSEISQIDARIRENKDNAELAKAKANEVKTGFFKSKTKALDELKDISMMNADANIQILDIVNKLSENQNRMSTACEALVKMGANNIDYISSTISSIETIMRDGVDKELSEETKARLVEVIRELKRKQDVLERMERQGTKINELNQRVKALEEELGNSKRTVLEVSKKQKSIVLIQLITLGIGLAGVILGVVNLLG